MISKQKHPCGVFKSAQLEVETLGYCKLFLTSIAPEAGSWFRDNSALPCPKGCHLTAHTQGQQQGPSCSRQAPAHCREQTCPMLPRNFAN